MTKIKFGTDGWRAIIAQEYTVENLRRVAQATADWLNKHHDTPVMVLAHDCRFGGKLFSEHTARVAASAGVKVILSSNKFTSTPMVSLATKELGGNAGIIITASHNPASYNGYKIKAHFGGPALPDQIEEVEDLIKDEQPPESESFQSLLDSGVIEYVDLEEMYLKKVEAGFDLEAIRNSGIQLAYDPMYGAGQNVIRRLFPQAVLLHAEYNPSFMGIAPEPIIKNLGPFSQMIASRSDIDLGLATDGDADRIGLFDGNGHFIDSHHILLLLINYLHSVKEMRGKVVVSFSCTNRIKTLCDHLGIEVEVSKIGFKYICGIMVEEDVLVGGEESGGIAIKGFIPERDGIWIGLTLMEYMAKSGKTITELIDEVYEITGSFANARNDLHIKEDLKQSIVQKCENGEFTQFGSYQVERTEDIDGYKFHLGNGETVMIRPSGTEPVLRIYAESADLNGTEKILTAVKETIL